MNIDISSVVKKIRLEKNTNNLNVKNKKNDYKFDDTLNKIIDKDDHEYKKVDEDENLQENSKLKNHNSKLSKKDIEKVKSILKDSGFKDEDIEEIESVDDLKKLFSEISIDDMDLDSEENISKLSVLLALILNNKEIINNDIDKNENGELIKSLTKKINNLSEEEKTDLMSKVKSTAQQLLGKEFQENTPSTLVDKIKQELSILINQGKEEDIKDSEVNKDMGSILNSADIKSTINSYKKANSNEDNNSLLKDGNSKSEEDFLKELVSQDKGDKISKVTTFMNALNGVKNDTAVNETEKILINKATFTNDLIKTVKFMQNNDLKDLTVKIMPKELGEVVISITVESGIMKADIKASNKEAYNLLNSNIQDISDKLQNNDIKIQNVSVNIYNEDTTFFKDESRNKNGNSGKGKKQSVSAVGDIEEEEEDKDSIIDSNVNILA